jgi:lysosomal alpha-mannosidase
MAFIETYSSGYRSNRHVLFTMGQDFSYQVAHKTFKNIDKLIKYMNERTDSTGYHLLYSTPSCYVKAVNEDVLEPWPEKTDDFFPYCDEGGPANNWTGYFTSRAAYKYLERVTNALLQSARQINALLAEGARSAEVKGLEKEMGVAQHHDAVTGTAKQHVDSDYRLYTNTISDTIFMAMLSIDVLALYRLRLNKARVQAAEMMGEVLFSHAGLNPDDINVESTACLMMNVSACAVTENANNPLLVLAYNPLPRPSDVKLRLPMMDTVDVTATAADGSALQVDTLPVWSSLAAHPSRADLGVSSNVETWLTIPQVPPMGEENEGHKYLKISLHVL